MIISIHQPDYIPYLGYFYKISKSDYFAFYDDAQFSNDNLHHQNKIKTSMGVCKLKIPVDYHFGDPINKVRTKDQLGWKEKHLKTIEMNYKRAKYFKEIYPFFKELLLCQYDSLADMNISINKFLCYSFGFTTNFIKVSELSIYSKKENKVIDICNRLQADTYYSGLGAASYQKEEHFKEKGIALQYTDYVPFEYPQLWGDFIPNLSVLDFIFNCGFDWDFVEQKYRVKGE